MNKPLVSLICAFVLLFSSCSKEETAAPKDEELYPVTFNVSTFSKEVVPMASLKRTAGQMSASTTSESSLADAITDIRYAVYNKLGTKVREKVTHSEEPGFGRIEDSLPKGKYTIMVFGSREYLNYTPYDLNDMYLMASGSGEDVFFKQIQIEVSGKEIDQNIQLIRKVGKVEIKLTDDIPPNIEEIIYSITGVSYFFYPTTNMAYGGGPYTRSNYYYRPNDERGEPDYTQECFYYFFLNYDEDAFASVSIRAYDRDRNLVVDKTINDVPVSINKKTILTGKLFDDVGSTKGQAFSISVDDIWNSESNHIEF